MDNEISSKSVILSALVANLFIAVLKLVVALLTASTAMLAEAVHSSADTCNQVFLLIGIRKGKKEPDSLHPFGFSGELYFWSFIVAIMLFTVGAVFSIYVGIHKLLHPHPLKNITYAFIVLFLSLIAEGFAFYRAFKKVNRERKGTKIVEYLRKTKKSELIVVFLEDWAAITGLCTAIILLYIQHITGVLIFDGIASIIIGLILAVVAFFLGSETRSLLLGESASQALIKQIENIFAEDDSINQLIYIKSLQLGPDNVMLAAKVEFNHRLSSVEISNLINGIEKEIRTKHPDVRSIFIEPDIVK